MLSLLSIFSCFIPSLSCFYSLCFLSLLTFELPSPSSLLSRFLSPLFSPSLTPCHLFCRRQDAEKAAEVAYNGLVLRDVTLRVLWGRSRNQAGAAASGSASVPALPGLPGAVPMLPGMGPPGTGVGPPPGMGLRPPPGMGMAMPPGLGLAPPPGSAGESIVSCSAGAGAAVSELLQHWRSLSLCVSTINLSSTLL